MRQLHLTTRMILIVALLLVINAVCIFAYRDAVLSCETQKDCMLNFAIKYETLANSLRNDATLYRNTLDPSYLDSFDEAIDDYYSLDAIDLGYPTLTQVQSPKQLSKLQSNSVLPLDAQIEFLDLNRKEEALFLHFHESYEKLLGYMKEGRNNTDFSILQTTEYESVYSLQADAMLKLNQQYITRINEQEDHILDNQRVMELTLISLSLLLLFLATFAFFLLTEKNADNSYYRKLYTTVVENVNVGLSLVNKSGEYEYMNPQYLKLLDIETADYIGKTADELFPAHVAKLLDICNDIPTEGHLNLEFRGVQQYMDYNHFIIFDENNQKKYVNLIHDRTETEHMQQQLRNQLRDIELYSHAKDAFLANISHEIKTPINAIVGMTHFLKQSELNTKQQEIVTKIQVSSDVLLAIINDVLDFSKIKAKSLHLYPTAFYLDSLLQNVESMFIQQIEAKGLSFECHYTVPEQTALYLDRTRLIQLLVNLLSNACKFTDSGRILLTAAVTEETESYIELEFCVEDTGIGIAEKDLSKLFLEFEQIENHLTKKHEGTGLGLSICKHITAAMGGKMWVTSTPEIGSKFYFSIPCPKITSEQLHMLEESTTAADCSLNGHGAHVLIAEDTDINMEIVTKLLTDANITCYAATDGEAAVDLCKQHPNNFFRLILMDIHMPRMDGYTAAQIIKEQLHVTTPILALTATSMEEASSQQKGHLMDGYILKPFKIGEFYGALKPFFPESGNPYGDYKVAIRNLGGMKDIYYKHVARFKENYANSGKEIRDFLEANDYEEAKRKVHTVKGLSGTLGMPDLYESSSILTEKITGQIADLDPFLQAYDKALQQVLESKPE